MAEDRKWKNIRKKSTEQSTGEKPPVDNSHEEEIPEWKSSIRKEPPTEKAEPEYKLMKHKKTIAAAAAIIVVGAVAFGVTPMLINRETEAKKTDREGQCRYKNRKFFREGKRRASISRKYDRAKRYFRRYFFEAGCK